MTEYTDDTIMPFGKYGRTPLKAGLPLKEVPADYLLWLYKQSWVKISWAGLYKYIEKNLRALKEEVLYEQDREEWES